MRRLDFISVLQFTPAFLLEIDASVDTNSNHLTGKQTRATVKYRP